MCLACEVLDLINEDANFQNLSDELAMFRNGGMGKYPIFPIVNYAFDPKVGLNSVAHSCTVKGETNEYDVRIEFFGIKFEKQDKEMTIDKLKKMYKTGKRKKDIKIPCLVGNTTYLYSVPIFGKNKVKVKCSCPDYRFRFEKSNFDSKANVGNWRKYKRVTPPPPEGRPYANQLGYLGFCKHIYSFLKWLEQENLIYI